MGESMTAKPWGVPQPNGNGGKWQYMIQRRFAWLPIYMEDQVVWGGFYWEVYPVDAAGNRIPGIHSYYPDDPGNGPTLAG
jgi:hypothetical protein